MQQGEAAILLRLVARKYGKASAPAYRERVEQADADMLLKCSERVLTAETIGHVFTD